MAYADPSEVWPTQERIARGGLRRQEIRGVGVVWHDPAPLVLDGLLDAGLITGAEHATGTDLRAMWLDGGGERSQVMRYARMPAGSDATFPALCSRRVRDALRLVNERAPEWSIAVQRVCLWDAPALVEPLRAGLAVLRRFDWRIGRSTDGD
jgi:hypothetical protein